jgi:quercetin dioxygenase-like cupin family protein
MSAFSFASARRGFHWTAAAALFLAILPIKADLNPAAISIQHPDQIKWREGNGGNATAILAGDPSKPGIYVELTKWHPGHMSRPHFHPNDRYIYVISGTWWVGTGTKYDPDSTVPVPAGSYVTHFAKQVHYDGAKDQEVVLEIVGEGPATTTGAEQK